MKLSVNPASQIPLHRQVEILLRSMIRQPAYRKGKLLPPETELATRLGISRNTLRAGIDKLVYEGLLIRKRGFGTRVVFSGTKTSRMESWVSFSREMAGQGVEVQTFSKRFSLRPAPLFVAEAFGIPHGTRVYAFERVRGFDGKPVVHFMSWFHPRLKMSGDDDLTRPLYDLLEEKYHVRAEHSHERITAVPADKSLAKTLQVTPGTPLLRRERRVTDPGDRPIEHSVNHYLSDKFEYTIDIKREGS